MVSPSETLQLDDVSSPASAGWKLPRFDSISRVEQRTNFDCLRCCVAMITGAPYEHVPDFVLDAKPWTVALQSWLNQHGAGFLLVGRDITEVPAGAAHIAIGMSRSGHMHAVVVTDRVIDPGVFNRPLAEDPRHRLVILPLADAPYLDAELATQMA